MLEEGFVCHTCRQVFPGSRDYSDNLHSAHQAQQVICPWCPKWAVFSLPGSLRRHVTGQHKGLEGEADLLAVNVAYYFATNPDLYHSTTVVKPLQHDVSKTSVAATQLGAKTLRTSESSTLLQKAETDWQHLGAQDPAVKVESTERKRSSEIPPIYSPKKLCISQNIPELEDLKLMAVELTNSFSRVFVSWFVFLVNIRLGEQQSCTLLCRMQALPKEGMRSKLMDEGKTVTDTGMIQEFSSSWKPGDTQAVSWMPRTVPLADLCQCDRWGVWRSGRVACWAKFPIWDNHDHREFSPHQLVARH